MAHDHARGVVLLLISGVVTILVLLSLAILQTTRIFGARAAARAASAQATLAAESGMAYAAARLCQDSMPGRWDIPGRGDDWSERQGSDNPSYSHGEAWIEGGTPDGFYAPPEARGQDLDRDGRFSAWSGRLRGRAPHDLRFSLRIESTEGKIPLNAGYLAVGDGIDNNGNGQIDEAGEADGLDNDMDGLVDEPGEPVDLDGPPGGFDGWGNWTPSKGDGIPDFNQATVPYHASLALVLDNLGAMLLDPATGTRRWDIPTSGEAIQTSWLGQDLIRCRPLGGYRTWEQVERTLLALDPTLYSGAPYKQEELDAIRPYVDLGPYGIPEEGARSASRLTLRTPRYAPISLWTAPQRVLESVWRYVSADSPADEYSWMTASYRSHDFVAEPDGYDELSPFSQWRFLDSGWQGSCHRLILFPLEAERLALEAIAFRRGGGRGWASFRRRLLERADALFDEDFRSLASAAPAPADRMKWGWCSAKANLAFAAVSEDPLPSKPLRLTSLWTSWGEEIDANREVAGRQLPPFIEFERLARTRLPAGGFDRGNPNPWGWLPTPFLTQNAGDFIRPQGLTLAPPLRFSVASRTGSAEIAGSLQTGERITLTSQEDFENLTGGIRFQGSGISVLETAGLPITDRRHAPSGSAPRTATLPRANRRDLIDPPAISDPIRPPLCGFSRAYGAIGLGTIEETTFPASAFFSWPLTEDFDAQNRTAPGPAWREFWSSPSIQPAASPPWLLPAPPFRLDPRLDAYEDGGVFTPTMMTPYGFGTGGAKPFDYPMAWKSIQWRPAWIPYPDPDQPTWSHLVLDRLSVEGRFGVGSILLIHHGSTRSSHIQIETRRGFRASPDRWGTELVFTCRWPYASISGNEGLWTQTWFVPDADTRGAWSYHVALTAQREAAGPWFKTRFKLWVNGRNSFPPEPPMELLWDATQPAYWWLPPVEDGQLVIGDDGPFSPPRMLPVDLGITGVDDLRLHAAVIDPAPGPRYVETGTFTSPLYSLDARARLKQAQWTGAVPAGGAISVQVTGYDDPWGGSPLSPPLPPLGSDAEVSDLSAMPPVRSFRYAVRLDRPPAQAAPAMDETPIFESIWFTLQRRGSSPAWTAWESR